MQEVQNTIFREYSQLQHQQKLNAHMAMLKRNNVNTATKHWQNTLAIYVTKYHCRGWLLSKQQHPSVILKTLHSETYGLRTAYFKILHLCILHTDDNRTRHKVGRDVNFVFSKNRLSFWRNRFFFDYRIWASLSRYAVGYRVMCRAHHAWHAQSRRR